MHDSHRVTHVREGVEILGEVGLRIPFDALEQRGNRDRRIIRCRQCIRGTQARQECAQRAFCSITTRHRSGFGVPRVLPQHPHDDGGTKGAQRNHTQSSDRSRVLAKQAPCAIVHRRCHGAHRIMRKPRAQVGRERGGAQ